MTKIRIHTTPQRRVRRSAVRPWLRYVALTAVAVGLALLWTSPQLEAGLERTVRRIAVTLGS